MGTALLVLILIGMAVWAVTRSSQLAERSQLLDTRLSFLEDRLRQLQKLVDSLRGASAPAAPPPSPAEPATVEHLLKQREEAKSVSPAAQPIVLASGAPAVAQAPDRPACGEFAPAAEGAGVT